MQKKDRTKRRIIFDLSILGATKAGVHVFAYNIGRSLTDQYPESVQLHTNPFTTFSKNGVKRKIYSLLRMFYQELIIFRGTRRDIYVFPAPEIPILALIFRLDYVIFIHDLYSWKNQKATTCFGRLRNHLLSLSAKKAYKVGTVSQFSSDQISRILGIQSDKIFIVSNGLGEIYKGNAEATPPEIKLDVKYLLAVGSLEPRKNLKFLVDVFEEIKKEKRYSKLQLIVVGRESWGAGDILARFESSREADSIKVLRTVNDVELLWLYRNAEVLVFPSKEEGFGIPIIEALSQSTPVVVNKNSALMSFEAFGAVVVDSYSVKEWAEVVLAILDGSSSSPPSYPVTLAFCWKQSARDLYRSVFS